MFPKLSSFSTPLTLNPRPYTVGVKKEKEKKADNKMYNRKK